VPSNFTDAFVSWIVFTVPTALVAGVAAYFGAYLQEKARNLATREDIDRVLRVQEEMRAQVSGSLWVAQERWRFKADLYTKALTTMTRMRQPLEVAATKGVWPSPEVWDGVLAASRDLFEPSVVGRIWFKEEAIVPLETQGTRILELARRRDSMTDKEVLMKLCELIETAIASLQAAARDDLELRVGSSR